MKTVAAVPLTPGSRQIVTLAVSPDGSQVAASALTVPTAATGHWRLEQYRGPIDGSPLKQVAMADLGTERPQPTMVLGWDDAGPVAALHLHLTASEPPMSVRFPDTEIVHLDATGGLSAPIGGPECGVALDETPAGVVLCSTDAETLVVRSADGTIRWQVRVKGPDQPYAPKALAPDGLRIAGLGLAYLSSGQTAELPQGFVPEGWLDTGTVVGRAGTDQHLWLVAAGGSARTADLGLAATYVGRI